MDKTGRIRYIDALRGFTMLLVVMWHCSIFGLDTVSPFTDVLETMRMPTFFFISGYIAFKAREAWTTGFTLKRLRGKAIVQLIPATVFLAIWELIFPDSGVGFREFFTIEHFNLGRYWFTYVLFYMFVIYYAVSWLTRRLGRAGSVTHDLLLVAIVVVFLIIFFNFKLKPWAMQLRFNLLLKHFQFFVIGVLCRKYNGAFMRAIANKWFTAAVVVIFAVTIPIVIYYKEINVDGWIYDIFHRFHLMGVSKSGHQYFNVWVTRILNYCVTCWAGLLIVFTFFRRKEAFFEGNSRLARTLVFIGRRTLDIYLLHYFFVPNLHGLAPLLEGNVLLQVVTPLVLAVCIVALCMVVSEIIRSSDFLAYYLLGVKKKKPKQ